MKRFWKYRKYFMPVISLVLAFFVAFPSSASASVISYMKIQNSFYQEPNIKASISTTPYQITVTSGTTTITSNRGSDTVVYPFSYNLGFLHNSTFPSNQIPAGTTSVWFNLPLDYSYNYVIKQIAGNTTHTFSFDFLLTWYLVSVTGQEVPLFTFSASDASGQHDSVAYFDMPVGIDTTLSQFWRLEARGNLILSGFSSGTDSDIFELEFIPRLTVGSRNYTEGNIIFWSGSGSASGGDIDDLQNSITSDINNQTDTITDGYDNSGLNTSGSDLADSVNDYDNIESNLMTNVDFSDVELTDAFSLPAFINTTTLYTSFLQGIYTSLGDAGIIVICSLCIAFAFALIGYRKYLDRGGG